MTLDPLSTLAVRHGTDKFGLHDYTPNYHRLFAPFRDRPVRLLEIGVGGYSDEDRGGQSLATWRDYFPAGEVTGLDIQRKVMDLGPRVRIVQGSQVDPAVLARLVEERGPFDLVVDDGSHRNEHVVESFRLLWPHLAPGGLHVVEDVQTAFMARFGGSADLAAPNTVGFFATLTGAVEGDIARVVRFHNVIAVQKAGGEAHALDDGEPVATLPASASEAELRAAFAALPVPGRLRIEGRPEGAMLALLRHLFVQVDHREIAHALPGTAIDPMAPMLQRVEVDAGGAWMRKAPNDFPSNFAFDASHPEAAAALAAMEAALEGWDGQEGLVAKASLVTTLHGREAAAGWLARAEAAGATSRAFFQMAGGLAQREKRAADAERHYGAGVERFLDDAILIQGLASACLALGDAEGARDALVAALVRTPRVAALHLALARVADRLGDVARAVGHATQAIAMSTGERREAALTTLGEVQARAGRLDEALSALTEAARGRGGAAARALLRISQIQAGLGRMAEAHEAAARALALRPGHPTYVAWSARLAAPGAAIGSPWEEDEDRASLSA